MRRYWLMKGAAAIVLIPAFVAAVSFVVMLLWNALVPSLFAGPALGFWQAVGLLVLCRILFGGFRGHGHRGWKHRAWRERWHRMTPEERDRFRDGIRRWRDMSHDERRAFRRGFRGCGGGMMDEPGEPKGATSAQREI
ncbi:MAG: hypothetical protein JWO04_1911 [Gammaproteobacteria bacterium]|nr:hypothetical protein [Gammaproteobacteria bacterium]